MGGGKEHGNQKLMGQLAEGQESCGGHSWLQLKLWVSQAVGGGGSGG